jgi:hypothetical protein
MENIQVKMQELFAHSCYAYCISYISGKRDIKDLTTDVLEGWKKGFIDDDGFVSQPHKFYNYCFGKELARDVRKPDYKPEPFDQIVCWENGKNTHFVVMRNDKIVFDPWPESNTVKNGKATTIREFI